MPASARRKAWDVFSASLDTARQHDSGAMPWDAQPKDTGPADAITTADVHMVLSAMLAAVGQAGDSSWRDQQIGKLVDIEAASMAGASLDDKWVCPECGGRKAQASAFTCSTSRCRMRRYRRLHAAETAQEGP